MTDSAPGTPGDSGLSWRVLGRFVDYVRSSGGSIVATGGAIVDATGMPSWPLEDGRLDARGAGRLRFGGEVRFSAHFGALDVAVTDPELEVGGSSAVLRIRTARAAAADLVLARSTWREVGGPEGVRVFVGEDVLLAPEAVPLFGGVYPERLALDPFVVAAKAMRIE